MGKTADYTHLEMRVHDWKISLRKVPRDVGTECSTKEERVKRFNTCDQGSRKKKKLRQYLKN